ncbi:MAG: ABC transporter ATP-binding protein [Ardenticatenaceae bacterium]|nr:ABC transporter ATP-binding protein [Ardenticatenaceae bacterium]
MTNDKVTLVKLQGVSKRFGEATAVSDITLDVPKGAILGFIGPSGCGKTTTVRLMVGNYKPTAGTVQVFNRAPDKFKKADLKRIGYMTQLFVLYPELTIWENLNFAASIYGYPFRRKERFAELLDLVELTGHEKKEARNISGGMQRRLSLAATLIHKPELIFLDEPTAGIDPVLRRKFWDHFHLLKEQGHTLFVTTQYVGEAAYCDYVGVMRNGRLLMVETPDGLRRRALGGEIVNMHTTAPVSGETLASIQGLPGVKKQPKLLDSQSVQILVEEADTAIPKLLHWSENNNVELDTINEFVPPFDDIFVKIMEDETAKEEVAA